MGNVVNRVFDSSGPEGKVRGTPQQIIDKYLILARDAQLSNDRVAAENFLQHAEHYTRMLGEAQRELQRESEQRRDYQDNNQNGQRERNGQTGRDRDEDVEDAQDNDPYVRTLSGSTDVIELAEEEDERSALVETPEARPAPSAGETKGERSAEARTDKPAPRRRNPRKPKAPGGDGPEGDNAGPDTTASAAE